jgi:hypothetical protein
VQHSRASWHGSGTGIKTRLVLAAVLLVTLAGSLTGCGSGGLNAQLNRITAGERFDLVRWEVGEIAGDLVRMFSRPADLADRSAEVEDYFSSVDNATVSADDVAAIIGAQVRLAYHDAGVDNPFEKLIKPQIGFPPVNIYLRKPPLLLVVSPRDHIERIKDVLLLPDLPVATQEKIEDEVTQLGYSGLVVDLGGIATYPSYVSNQYGLEFALQTAAHEWLHQYLAFTPLGFDYVLSLAGLKPNPDIAAINETVASLVGDEIGTDVYNKYYAANQPATTPAPPPSGQPAFDFNAAMRETRLHVDDLLAHGRVDEAEAYMNQRRDYINANGYYIRKLNQAYFAFYGTYTNAPTSVDPLGQELRDLRTRSGSLKDFLAAVTTVTTRDQVASLAGK